MRRMMVLFCLTVMQSGPLLRQAEAASDMARALASSLDARGVLTEPDGGVGDDTGEMTQRAMACQDLAHVDPLSPDGWAEIEFLSSLMLAHSPPHFATPSRVLWLPARSAQRQAWLQLYLF